MCSYGTVLWRIPQQVTLIVPSTSYINIFNQLYKSMQHDHWGIVNTWLKHINKQGIESWNLSISCDFNVLPPNIVSYHFIKSVQFYTNSLIFFCQLYLGFDSSFWLWLIWLWRHVGVSNWYSIIQVLLSRKMLPPELFSPISKA